KVSVISGISVSPRRQRLGLYYQLYFDNVGQEEVCVLLRELLRHLRGPVIVLLDNSSTHQEKSLQHLLQQHPRLHRWAWGGVDYKGALAAGLPIGSGEIESAHGYVFQKRLKISGAWWKMENLKKVIALRVLRANGDWEEYWTNVHQEAA